MSGASVHFGPVVALDGIDLEVAAGEVVAILGPSGSGKSTLLRAVAGLQRLDAGRVLIAERDVTDAPPHRRRVGLMFQDHALFPHRDVAGNVAFGLRMQRRAPAEITARVGELLQLVDLEGYEHRRIDTLSGGEQQRVALARALAPRPEVLLLDEPLGALDRTLREHLVTELSALFGRLGLTVVAVTHDQEEAFTLADRVAVMDAGRILQVSSPATLWGRPASRRVAHLLGFANIVDVTVRRHQASTPWGDVPVPQLDDGPASIVIRPEGVTVGPPSGGVVGVVEAARFAAGRVTLRIAVPGAPVLEASVPAAEAVPPGRPVQVAVEPAAVIPLPGKPAGGGG